MIGGPATTSTSSTMSAMWWSRTPARAHDAVFSTVNFALAANVETLVLQGGADLQRHRQRARQQRSSATPATTCSTAGRRRRSHRQRRQRHLRVQRRRGQRRHRRGLRRQRRGGGRFAAVRRLRRRARPSPTSTRRTGRSTTTAAPRTTIITFSKPPRSMPGTSCFVSVAARNDNQIARRRRLRAVVRRSNFTPNAASSRSSSNMSCARPCATIRPASITMTLSKN